MKLENKLLIKWLIVCAMMALILTCSCTPELTTPSRNYYMVAWCTEDYVFFFTDDTRSEIKKIKNKDNVQLMYGDIIIDMYPF